MHKVLVLCLILLSAPCSGWGAPIPAEQPFDNPRDEGVFNKIQENHSDAMMELEHIFGNPYGSSPANTQRAKDMRAWWDMIRDEIKQEDGEAFFGKEFYTAFIQYHQHRVNAVTHFITSDFDGAMSGLLQAKATAERLKQLPMRYKDCFSYLFVDKMILEMDICLGITECARGKIDQGLAALSVAGNAAANARWHWGRAQAAYYMGLYAEWARLPTAEILYAKALDLARENRVHYFTWQCCYRLAVIRMQDGHIESAISLLEEAVISIEFLRTKTEEDVRSIAFMGNKFQVYRMLTQVLLDKGDIRKALEVSENAKSRVLQDLLGSSHTLGRWGAGNYHWMMREQVLAEKIECLEGAGGAQSKDAEVELEALRKEHENLLAQIRQNNPDYGVLKVGGSADAGEIQALPDENTALLEYNMMHDRLVAWVVTKSSIRMESIALNNDGLTKSVQATRMMMGKPKTPAVYKLLGQLYESIIKPFEQDIQEKNLVVVPDGALHYLPFAALMDSAGKFLVENHTLSVVPSSSVLKFCRAKSKGKSKTILAFGNPDLQDAKMDLPSAQLEVESIVEKFPKLEGKVIAEKLPVSPGVPLLRGVSTADLPNAQIEVKNITERFPQTEAYLRKEASESLAKKLMGEFDIIHFACHGEMETGDPMLSCLRLAPDEANDGKLTAGEIFDLKLKAQLVILSGCETGRGEIQGGDEMIGLTRSFLYAGTPCLIASLWKVDDNATSILMQNFYANLAKSGKAEALRAAQIATMQVKKHPYYWASFYLVGDGG